jgi:glutamyl/glutaminyl-tRNA synthetase
MARHQLDDGPYKQSERTDLYRKFAKTLLEKGSPINASAQRKDWKMHDKLPSTGANPPGMMGDAGISRMKIWKSLKGKADLT